MIKDVENINVEKLVREKRKMITTTQLRLLLSNAVIVKNKIELKANKGELPEELEREVKYLLIKHMYQCGREEKLKKFDNIFEISNKLRKIKTAEEFNKFYRYLEEIVAYVKYYNE